MTLRVRSELIVSAILEDAAIAKYKENVTISNGAQAMSNHNRSSSLHGPIKSLLDNLLTVLIKGRSGLIKKQDAGVFDERSGNRNPLLLPTRELATLEPAVFLEALM